MTKLATLYGLDGKSCTSPARNDSALQARVALLEAELKALRADLRSVIERIAGLESVTRNAPETVTPVTDNAPVTRNARNASNAERQRAYRERQKAKRGEV